MFIVLEGNEAVGKSSIAKQLKKRLGGDEKVLLTREPGGSLLGEAIRNLILTEEKMDKLTEAYLFAAARAEHMQKTVIPALNAGKIVIMDRYDYSSYAYQGVANGLGFENVLKLNQPFLKKTYRPNIAFLIEVTSEERCRRLEKRPNKNRLDTKDESFYQLVDKGYAICLEYFDEMVKINGNQPFNTVIDKMIEIIKEDTTYDG